MGFGGVENTIRGETFSLKTNSFDVWNIDGRFPYMDPLSTSPRCWVDQTPVNAEAADNAVAM